VARGLRELVPERYQDRKQEKLVVDIHGGKTA
jgi:hypothetical protein